MAGFSDFSSCYKPSVFLLFERPQNANFSSVIISFRQVVVGGGLELVVPVRIIARPLALVM